jgi:SAM-dependent methyltransferase
MISQPPTGQRRSAPGKEASPQGASASGYLPKEYWEKLAASGGANEAQARAVVLHPDAPGWFNRTIDRLQAKAWSRALRRCELGGGARVLDVGCGTGRWLERLERADMRPTGADRTAAMLQIARQRLPGPALVAAEAQRLPFADASFDCVCAVTVLQHIRWEEQAQALEEMARVARPGACIVLLDLIRGNGPHIFPRAPEDWIELGSRASVQLIAWSGQEFLLFDRPLRRAAAAIRGLAPQDGLARLPRQAAGERSGVARHAYWMARRLAVMLSLWTEPLAERVCPQSFGTHGVFVFRKPAQEA